MKEGSAKKTEHTDKKNGNQRKPQANLTRWDGGLRDFIFWKKKEKREKEEEKKKEKRETRIGKDYNERTRRKYVGGGAKEGQDGGNIKGWTKGTKTSEVS